ncbi:MAG: hypothetical protein WC822_02420 [Candidatus Paceibacterota bacterium]
MNEPVKSKDELVAKLISHPRYQQARGAARSYNCPVSREDLEAELNRGIAMALQNVDLERGDPMEYLLSRGMLWVKRVVRAECNHNVIEECIICGKVRPYRQEPCSKCGGRDFILHPRFLPFVLDGHGKVRQPGEDSCKTFGGRVGQTARRSSDG